MDGFEADVKAGSVILDTLSFIVDVNFVALEDS